MNICVKDKTSIVYTLQKVFAYMSLSKSLSFYPSELIHVLNIDTEIQCDVHEFFHRFITELKHSLSELKIEQTQVFIITFSFHS